VDRRVVSTEVVRAVGLHAFVNEMHGSTSSVGRRDLITALQFNVTF
jgi:hypothetical protein